MNPEGKAWSYLPFTAPSTFDHVGVVPPDGSKTGQLFTAQRYPIPQGDHVVL